MPNWGNYSRLKPNIEDKKNINLAILFLNKLEEYNFSQGAVASSNKIIAIEGKTGTQEMLKKIRSKKNKNNGC